jgi:hypothetical protein
MKGSENVGHVVSSMGEDDSAAGMLVPRRDIVDFVLVDDPGIIGCDL